MIVLILLAATLQGPKATPIESAPVAREQRRLSIPPEIAPAVVPYFQCVMSAMNKEAETSAIASAEAAREAQRLALAGCQATRDEAKAKAIEMLSRSNVEQANREAFAEMALASIDHAHDPIAERLERLERNAQK